MFIKEKYKILTCLVVTILMILTIGDSGIKKVFAKTSDRNNETVEKNIVNQNEIKNINIMSIVNKIQRENMGISSIRVVNDLKQVKVDGEIEFEVQDELGEKVDVDNLIFTINNEELGKMDKNIPNKFIKLGTESVVIKVTLKDRPNIKDEIIL